MCFFNRPAISWTSSASEWLHTHTHYTRYYIIYVFKTCRSLTLLTGSSDGSWRLPWQVGSSGVTFKLQEEEEEEGERRKAANKQSDVQIFMIIDQIIDPAEPTKPAGAGSFVSFYYLLTFSLRVLSPAAANHGREIRPAKVAEGRLPRRRWRRRKEEGRRSALGWF